jgi:hypothetical protein
MTDLRITGWAKDAVQAFGHVTNDDPDTARDIVRRMSPRDRAVLSFTLEELSRIVSEEEQFRTTANRRRAREDVDPSLGDIVQGHLRDI